MIGMVFGASSGIGEAVLKAMNDQGDYSTILRPTRSHLDVSDARAVDRWFARYSGYLHGWRDIHVVYSAGVNYLEWIGRIDPDKMADVINTNLCGFISVLNGLRRYTHPSSLVRVVSVSSDAAVRPMRTSIAYCASKAGQEMAMRVAARELGGSGWSINSVAPGMTEGTGMTAYVDKRVPEVREWSAEYAAEYERQQAVQSERILRDDVAKLVLEVLRMPRSVNGATFTINGGRS